MRALPAPWAFALAAGIAMAQPGPTVQMDAEKIAARFVQLAGSQENALALVLALRTASPVRLVSAHEEVDRLPEVVGLEPPTAPMALNDVRISLLHAQDTLVRAGIIRPTPEQVHAALVGGEVTNPEGVSTLVRGVLQMRAEGLSWVDIARQTTPAEAYQPPSPRR
ncbi:MAG TPA: hypothetical protein VFK48_12280 [Usitatibacter sp.]|nr:hypothetical protein [Usitatibacter sp.]